MKDRLQIDLSKARFKNFKSVFEKLEKALIEAEIDFYVLGALARDMHFSVEHIDTRTTADVDLAVYINSREDDKYKSLRNNLVLNHDFRETKNNNFALISPEGVTIDLLPFGEIEIQDGVRFEGEGLLNIKVNGFKEVHLKGLQEVISDNEVTFKVANLSSIVLLKLIAFDDRPEWRTNDPGDIASIIANYFDLNADNIYENHNDLFETDQVELTDIAAQVIGREINIVLKENEKLHERVIHIIENHISKAEKSPFILGMIGDFCKQIDTAVLWMKTILQGINE